MLGAPLSWREMEAAYLLGTECMSTKMAARQMECSYRTVEMYRSRLFRKLGIVGQTGTVNAAAMLARRLALAEGADFC
jgi:DNA-binding CsgD family transcriptional regulator